MGKRITNRISRSLHRARPVCARPDRLVFTRGLAAVLKPGQSFAGVYAYGNALLRRNSEYPLFDGHGCERTVTNGSQTVTGSINFEAFGQTVGTSGSSDSPCMYAGA